MHLAKFILVHTFCLWAQCSTHSHSKAKLPDGMHIHTSAVQEMAVEEGGLVLVTYSGTRYVLKPEGIHPRCGEDAASHPEMGRDIGKETVSSLEQFGIGAGFMEDCLRARREADARLMEEEGRLLEPEELLLTTRDVSVVRALFRTADGTPVSVEPTIHSGMFQDSILVTDWKCGTVDFRYFPMGDRMEPYHISDGLKVIKVRNIGNRPVYFGKPGREVICPPGELTAIPAAEHDDEGLFSPDAVNGKGLYQTMLSENGEETDDP